MEEKDMIKKTLFYIGLVFGLFYVIFPFYWALNGSLLPEEKIFRPPLTYAPIPPTLESYRQAFGNEDFVYSIRNSIIVAGGTTLLALLIGSMAAGALARYGLRGKNIIMLIILSMTMFPQISVLGAIHKIISSLGMYNRLPGLILSYMLFTLPFTVWVLASFLESLPKDLEEAAYVDGATPFQTFWRILVPLALPGMVTTGLLAFIAAWNEYLFALSLTNTNRARTVPVAIANFAGEGMHQTPWGAIMAASVVVTLPLVILVLIFQRKIIGGMTAGAVKE